MSLCMSVCLSGTSLSKALNLHLLSHRSVSDLSQVSLRSVSGQSQVSLKLVSGLSQVSLRSLCASFVRQKEPKILSLVVYSNDRCLIHVLKFHVPFNCIPLPHVIHLLKCEKKIEENSIIRAL